MNEQKEEDFHSVGCLGLEQTLKEEQDIELVFQIQEFFTQISIHFMPQQ